MVSVLHFDRLSQRETDRPFKSYLNRSASLPVSAFYPSPFPSGASMDHLRQATYDSSAYSDMQSYSMASRGVKSESAQQPYGFNAHIPSSIYSGSSMGLGGYSMPPTPATTTDPTGSPSNGQQPPQQAHSTSPLDSTSASATPSMPDSSTHSTLHQPMSLPITPRPPPKKRANPIPVEQKDTAYWEKRKKNNDSAKRSRDARRAKEEMVGVRVIQLEQENMQLKAELSVLRSEIEKLRYMLWDANTNQVPKAY